METRENRQDSSNLVQNDKKEDAAMPAAIISNFTAKIRRIDTQEIELPKVELIPGGAIKSKDVDESVIISKLHDDASQPSNKGFKGYSEGTNHRSSNMLASSNKILNVTGGQFGAIHSNASHNKSPSIGNSVSAGDPELESMPEATLQSLLAASLKDKASLEQKVQKLDVKIRSLQRSKLDKSRGMAHPKDNRSVASEVKTTVKVHISPIRQGARTALEAKIVQEVYAESPSLVNRSALIWRHLDSLLQDTLTVKHDQRIIHPVCRPDQSAHVRTLTDKAQPSLKKRDLLIKSSREPKPMNRTFTYQAATSVASEKAHQPQKVGKTSPIRSFSINSGPKSSIFHAKNQKEKKRFCPSKALIMNSLDESFIFS